MNKPFLVIQLREEDEVADDELAAFMRFGGLKKGDVQRIRMESEPIPDDIVLTDYSGVIVGGGPSNVSDKEEVKSPNQKRFEKELVHLMEGIIEADFPFMGACYGLGFLSRQLGGVVSKEHYSEGVGAIDVRLTDEAENDPLTVGLPKHFRAFAGHKEACENIPPGAVLLANSKYCPVQMIRYGQNVYGVQFHTELDKAGIILRINTYKHAGYFPPEDADILVAAAHKEEITEPEKILKRFVDRYRVSSGD